jgi:hypothetical protein
VSFRSKPAAAGTAAGQGLTIVHFPAQLEPFRFVLDPTQNVTQMC